MGVDMRKFKKGDLVTYYGGFYEVFSVSKTCEVLGIRRGVSKAYVLAWKCRKAGF